MSRVLVASLALCLGLTACNSIATPYAGLPAAAGASAERRQSTHGYKTIYAFDGAHGASPNSPLLFVKGHLYGTTEAGGDWSTGGGTAFVLTTNGKEQVLHSFGKGDDGEGPVGSLTLLNGTFYGVTSYGGKYGAGTVFSVTPSGSEQVLHSFGKGKDGKQPDAGLAVINGVLYGTTEGGGAKGSGVLFSITTTGTENLLYDFPRGYGGPTRAALTPFKGTLYGVRFAGGCGNGGEAFSATTDGNVQFIYSFGGKQCSEYGDGLGPDGTMVAVKGAFYGTTFEGGYGSGVDGTVYRLTASGKESVLHTFGSKEDGRYPECVLLPVKGTLYGVTIEGGANEGGTVFSVTPSGTEKVLYNFGYRPDAGNPDGGLVEVKGVLYGTTRNGGGKPYGAGTVFSILP